MDRNSYLIPFGHRLKVALRKESVDRNPVSEPCEAPTKVALRKESVDRNQSLVQSYTIYISRSPQGERG